MNPDRRGGRLWEAARVGALVIAVVTAMTTVARVLARRLQAERAHTVNDGEPTAGPQAGGMAAKSLRTGSEEPRSESGSAGRLGRRNGLLVATFAVGAGGGLIAAAQRHGLAVVVLALTLGAAATACGVWARSSRGGHARSPILGEVATDAGVALVTGAVLGLVLFPVEEDRFAREQAFEEDRVEREVRRHNIRFVREVVTQPDASTRPFASLDLEDAVFAGLDLDGANFDGADLSGAVLRDAGLRDANLIGADLSGADLSSAEITGTGLRGADLHGANLRHATLYNSNLTLANLRGADLTNAYLNGVLDVPVDGEPTEDDLTVTSLDGADLAGAVLADADLTNADLTDADLTNANLRGADLTYANLTDADLTGVRYDAATEWPSGLRPPPARVTDRG